MCLLNPRTCESFFFLALAKRLGRNSLWNMKNTGRENNIWLVYWLKQKHGEYYCGSTQHYYTGLRSFGSDMFSFFFSSLSWGEKKPLLTSFLFSLMTYFICWNTIPPQQGVAVVLQSLVVFKLISYSLSLKQVSSVFWDFCSGFGVVFFFLPAISSTDETPKISFFNDLCLIPTVFMKSCDFYIENQQERPYWAS